MSTACAVSFTLLTVILRYFKKNKQRKKQNETKRNKTKQKTQKKKNPDPLQLEYYSYMVTTEAVD